MSAFVTEFLRNCWNLTAEMAPYLLLGFAVAGLLHWLIRKELVRRWLGEPGFGGVFRASVVGVPMPLCSCSVIPVAASLHKSGASRGATASFLSSTPQTGVDSILATYGLLGGAFTIVRVLVAFISGFVSGVLVDLFARKEETKETPETISLTPKPLAQLAPELSFSNLTPVKPPPPHPQEPKRTAKDAWHYGTITLPSDLGIALLTGLLLAGLITTLMPEGFLSGSIGAGLTSFVVATLISLPLYVCSTGSIPMAYALMTAGLSPGAALVFLIIGPATNTATIVAVLSMLGRKATAIYIISLVVISWTAGWIFNQSFEAASLADHSHHHEGLHPAHWQHASAALLLALFAYAYWCAKRPQATKPCCS